jgi:translation initiation factor 3 subunit E
VLSSLWGRLAAQVLTQSWDAALESLVRLRDAVDSEGLHAPAAEQVQRRAWLLHWALFVFFNHEAGRTGLVDLFFADRYLNAAQTAAPHLLRYAAVAAVVNRRRRGVLRDLARVVEQEAYEYSDPITEFVRRLFTNADFEGAREALAEAIPVMEGDFFVAALAREFADAARLLIFESYCRVHERVDLGLLSEKLGLDTSEAAAAAAAASTSGGGAGAEKSSDDASADAAEAWIVDLIRTARLRARVDSRARAVVIASAFPSVQDQLIETVKGLTQRTQVLANAVGAGAPRP